MVRVPVLSSSTVSALPIASIAPPPLTMIPRRAARETPEMIAIGVARISGQGVATTSTAKARTSSPETIQAAAATTTVTGRKMIAKRSASRTTGARSSWALRTSLTIPA